MRRLKICRLPRTRRQKDVIAFFPFCCLAFELLLAPVLYDGGTIGILEPIADYAGVVRDRDLRILRSLVHPLSEYLKEVPKGELDPGDPDHELDDGIFFT